MELGEVKVKELLIEAAVAVMMVILSLSRRQEAPKKKKYITLAPLQR